MPFKVQVGPPHIAIHQAMTVLVTEPDGQVQWNTDKGLYFFDTRLISGWYLFSNGEPWDVLSGGAITHDTARIFLTNRGFVSERGPVPLRTLGLVLSRHLDGGLHEDIDLTNFGPHVARFTLDIAIGSDFADTFDIKDRRAIRRGRINAAWEDGAHRLAITYRNADFHRGVMITAAPPELGASYANGRLSFAIELAPGATWHTCLRYDLIDGDRHFAAPQACVVPDPRAGHAAASAAWGDTVPSLQTSNEEFYRLYHQALEDMAALRLPIGGSDVVPAAGLPWFMAPFGRDSLIVSLQTILIHPEFSRGALAVLGRWQATERDDERDAEPGKIMHELRYGELAHFKLIPHTPYYGTADATPLYLIALHAAWRASGDIDLLHRFLPNAEAALRWVDEFGDRDGDGLQEYQTRSSVGYENMAWKDAGDSMNWPDGTPVRGPKALCELQGYVYDAWLRMAEVFEALDRRDRAVALREKAARLQRRFDDAFWDEATGFYAFMLDGDKRKVLSVASNPGHLLWSGIVPPERAARVVARLMAPDMYSGWGIRTLSSEHAAYNPYSYQNGSVWPHDNSLIALGCKRYGFTTEVSRIARDISEAASHFQLQQLPELYAGIERTAAGFPVQVLGANVPQAWAAGSAFALLQALLGIEPDAPRGRLHVDPVLPRWLPDVTITNLPLGKQTFDLRFWREGDRTEFAVLRGDAGVVRRTPNADVYAAMARGEAVA